MDDSRGRRVIDCANVTVEYETHGGTDAVLLVPYPPAADPDESDGSSVLLTGSHEAIRAVLSSVDSLLNDIEESP